MNTITVSDKLKEIAKDLSKEPPRSARETLAGYVIAGRTLDKCRAHLNGTPGQYNFNKFMDGLFFEFAGIQAEAFKTFVATGASDAEVGEWIGQHSQQQDKLAIVKWNNQVRGALIKEMPDSFQLFMEDYIAAHLPPGRVVYHVLDVFDIEEGRL